MSENDNPAIEPAIRATVEKARRLDISEILLQFLRFQSFESTCDEVTRNQCCRHGPKISRTSLRRESFAARSLTAAIPHGLNCLPLMMMRLALLIIPTALPFLAALTSISTSSPGLKVFFDQPTSVWETGFWASRIQWVVLPLSSLASTFAETCGLA